MTLTHSYVETTPPAALAGFVDSIWVQRVPLGAPALRHRNIPNGSAEVLCRLGDAPRLAGPRTAPSVEVLKPGTTVVGARIRPAAAHAMTGIPAHELVDASSELDAAPLRDAVDPGDAVERLEHLLLARAADAFVDPVVAATVAYLERPPHAGLEAIRARLGLSERQFRRRVRDAVGLTPKLLDRMLRFQRVLASAQRGLADGGDPADAGLAALAATHGYADQSHLTRECRRLTGLTLGAYLAEIRQDCGCGHDHAASYERILSA